MITKVRPINVAIVGGGTGCKAITDMIFAKKLGQLRMKLIGVACTNPKAVGYRYAQKKGIYTTKDYRDLYKLNDLNMIIELTGREEVANHISQTKPDHVRLVDHVAARLFWDVFQIEEKSISASKRAEERLRKAHDELERRVEERTSKLSKSNALLKLEITERKRVEEEVRKKNEELENFAHVVSHELKTPIISIQGFSSRLLKKYQERLDEKARTYLEQIQGSARRMELFVSDLLSLARIGQVVSSFNDVSSFEIVKDVVSRLQPRQKEKEIKLDIVDILPTIWCDRERVSQVFENLLVNAIKYMGDTENPKIEIGYEDNETFHQFYVRDNGVGIDAKYHEKVFEMFHRLREVEKEEGTGLGLAIVERIVHNHRGRVWVESEPEIGSTFYFTIPAAV